jgi:cell division protein ZapA
LEKLIRIKILEHEYVIKSDESPEQVERIAQFVNQKFNEIQSNALGLSEKKTAILAAFHIASEYFQLMKEREELVSRLQTRAKALVRHIESRMGQGSA